MCGSGEKNKRLPRVPLKSGYARNDERLLVVMEKVKRLRRFTFSPHLFSAPSLRFSDTQNSGAGELNAASGTNPDERSDIEEVFPRHEGKAEANY